MISGMAFLIISWRMSFGNHVRVPLLATIPDDIYDTLGGVRNVRDLCKAKFPSPREMALPLPICCGWFTIGTLSFLHDLHWRFWPLRHNFSRLWLFQLLPR